MHKEKWIFIEIKRNMVIYIYTVFRLINNQSEIWLVQKQKEIFLSFNKLEIQLVPKEKEDYSLT